MRILLTIIIGIWISGQISGQGVNTWTTLGMVKIQKKFDPNYGFEVDVPKPSPTVLALHDKEIEVEGYFIPLNGQIRQSHFMLSKFPESTCFFCGKAGPETAMQVFMKDNKRVAYSPEKIKVKGILKVNPTDANSLLYSLENAVLIRS